MIMQPMMHYIQILSFGNSQESLTNLIWDMVYTPEEAVANWLYNMWGITHFMVTEILQNVSVYATFNTSLERHTFKINSFEEAVCKEGKEEVGIVVRYISVKVTIHI